jgi:hypothetical protein
MSIEELVPLTNGLSVTAGPHTFVCDRARITPVVDATDSIDMSFWIAGTDYSPRLRLSRARLAAESPDRVAHIVRSVARRAVLG